MTEKSRRLLTTSQLKSFLYLKAVGIEVSETALTNQRKYSDCLLYIEDIIRERNDFLEQNKDYQQTQKAKEVESV